MPSRDDILANITTGPGRPSRGDILAGMTGGAQGPLVDLVKGSKAGPQRTPITTAELFPRAAPVALPPAPEPEPGPFEFAGPLGKFIDLIDTPRAAIVSTIKETGDLFRGEGFSPTDWWKQTEGNLFMQDVMRDWGVDLPGPLEMVIGLGLDIAFDPITYATGGIGAAGRAGMNVPKLVKNLSRGAAYYDDIAAHAIKTGAGKAGVTLTQAQHKGGVLRNAAMRVSNTNTMNAAGREALQEVGLLGQMGLFVPTTGRLGRGLRLDKLMDAATKGTKEAGFVTTRRARQASKLPYIGELARPVAGKTLDDATEAVARYGRAGLDDAAAAEAKIVKRMKMLARGEALPDIADDFYTAAARMASRMPVEAFKLPGFTGSVLTKTMPQFGKAKAYAFNNKHAEIIDTAFNTKASLKQGMRSKDYETVLAANKAMTSNSAGWAARNRFMDVMSKDALVLRRTARRLGLPTEVVDDMWRTELWDFAPGVKAQRMGADGLPVMNPVFREKFGTYMAGVGDDAIMDFWYQGRKWMDDALVNANILGGSNWLSKSADELWVMRLALESTTDPMKARLLIPGAKFRGVPLLSQVDDPLKRTVDEQIRAIAKSELGDGADELFDPDIWKSMDRYLSKIGEGVRRSKVMNLLEEQGIVFKEPLAWIKGQIDEKTAALRGLYGNRGATFDKVFRAIESGADAEQVKAMRMALAAQDGASAMGQQTAAWVAEVELLEAKLVEVQARLVDKMTDVTRAGRRSQEALGEFMKPLLQEASLVGYRYTQLQAISRALQMAKKAKGGSPVDEQLLVELTTGFENLRAALQTIMDDVKSLAKVDKTVEAMEGMIDALQKPLRDLNTQGLLDAFPEGSKMREWLGDTFDIREILKEGRLGEDVGSTYLDLNGISLEKLPHWFGEVQESWQEVAGAYEGAVRRGHLEGEVLSEWRQRQALAGGILLGEESPFVRLEATLRDGVWSRRVSGGAMVSEGEPLKWSPAPLEAPMLDARAGERAPKYSIPTEEALGTGGLDLPEARAATGLSLEERQALRAREAKEWFDAGKHVIKKPGKRFGRGHTAMSAREVGGRRQIDTWHIEPTTGNHRLGEGLWSISVNGEEVAAGRTLKEAKLVAQAEVTKRGGLAPTAREVAAEAVTPPPETSLGITAIGEQMLDDYSAAELAKMKAAGGEPPWEAFKEDEAWEEVGKIEEAKALFRKGEIDADEMARRQTIPDEEIERMYRQLGREDAEEGLAKYGFEETIAERRAAEAARLDAEVAEEAAGVAAAEADPKLQALLDADRAAAGSDITPPDPAIARRAVARRKVFSACTGPKCELAEGATVAAEDLYTGEPFKFMRRRIDASDAELGGIISAKHGVLDPAELVGSYDVQLPKSGAAAKEIIEGPEQLRKFADLVGDAEELFFYGSSQYRALMRHLLKRAQERNLVGRHVRVVEAKGGIGDIKGSLGKWAGEGSAAPRILEIPAGVLDGPPRSFAMPQSVRESFDVLAQDHPGIKVTSKGVRYDPKTVDELEDLLSELEDVDYFMEGLGNDYDLGTRRRLPTYRDDKDAKGVLWGDRSDEAQIEKALKAFRDHWEPVVAKGRKPVREVAAEGPVWRGLAGYKTGDAYELVADLNASEGALLEVPSMTFREDPTKRLAFRIRKSKGKAGGWSVWYKGIKHEKWVRFDGGGNVRVPSKSNPDKTTAAPGIWKTLEDAKAHVDSLVADAPTPRAAAAEAVTPPPAAGAIHPDFVDEAARIETMVADEQVKAGEAAWAAGDRMYIAGPKGMPVYDEAIVRTPFGDFRLRFVGKKTGRRVEVVKAPAMLKDAPAKTGPKKGGTRVPLGDGVGFKDYDTAKDTIGRWAEEVYETRWSGEGIVPTGSEQQVAQGAVGRMWDDPGRQPGLRQALASLTGQTETTGFQGVRGLSWMDEPMWQMPLDQRLAFTEAERRLLTETERLTHLAYASEHFREAQGAMAAGLDAEAEIALMEGRLSQLKAEKAVMKEAGATVEAGIVPELYDARRTDLDHFQGALRKFNATRTRDLFDSALTQQTAAQWGPNSASPGWSQGWSAHAGEGVQDAPLFEMLNALFKTTSSAGDFSTFLKWYDKFLNYWKAQAVSTPGFVLRNGLGGSWLSYAFGLMELGSTNKFAGTYFRALRGGEGDAVKGIDSMIATLLGTKKKTLGVGFGSRVDVNELRTIRRVLDSGIVGGGQVITEVDRSVAMRLVKESRNPFTGNPIDVVFNPASTEFAPFRFIRSANEQMETVLRGALAFDVLQKGGSVGEAASQVYKFHFNYADLTATERKARRIIPFWTWQKNVVPILVESLGKHPYAWGRLQQVKGNLELQSKEEGVVPDYFLENMAIRLPWKINEYQAYWIPDLPFRDLNRLMKEPTSITRVFAESAAPPVKVPLEIWAGKQFFADLPFSGRFQQVPHVYDKFPFLMQALALAGKAKKNKKGEYKMRDQDLYMLDSWMPFLSRFRRLLPNEERYSRRVASTVVSTVFGTQVRINDPHETRNQMLRDDRAFDEKMRDLIDIEMRVR